MININSLKKETKKPTKETIQKALLSSNHFINFVINFLVNNKHIINKLRKNKYEEFEFPEYAFLPKKIANRMSTDLVDLIQQYIHLLPNNVDKFKKEIKMNVTKGMLC